VQGGWYKNTMHWIVSNCNIKHGQLMRDIFENFYMQHSSTKPLWEKNLKQWEKIIGDSTTLALFDVTDNQGNSYPIYYNWYFMTMAFVNHDSFTLILIDWLQKRYGVPYNTIKQDHKFTMHMDNFAKVQRHGLYTYSFKKKTVGQVPTRADSDAQEKIWSLVDFFTLYRDSGNIMNGSKKLLGIIPTK
jgi:hypothetical protein